MTRLARHARRQAAALGLTTETMPGPLLVICRDGRPVLTRILAEGCMTTLEALQSATQLRQDGYGLPGCWRREDEISGRMARDIIEASGADPMGLASRPCPATSAPDPDPETGPNVIARRAGVEAPVSSRPDPETGPVDPARRALIEAPVSARRRRRRHDGWPGPEPAAAAMHRLLVLGHRRIR